VSEEILGCYIAQGSPYSPRKGRGDIIYSATGRGKGTHVRQRKLFAIIRRWQKKLVRGFATGERGTTHQPWGVNGGHLEDGVEEVEGENGRVLEKRAAEKEGKKKKVLHWEKRVKGEI